ncbi:MAG: OFA family MFS transporter [Bacteroidales bacterium]|nr:OFA family MFS transporter [Bacteroidales bacterium]MDD4671555.1 OFA family MFS transporter [Bacteroidales bacterium]MDY0348289.1 OFA family MFS transporter [Tenuifilaceae bacterium]
MKTKKTNRWFIAIMGTILQVVLGTVYAWSFFQKPIVTTFGWTNVQTMWIFSLAIVFLGLSAAWGGVNLAKFGPRKLATTGAILYGVGYFIGAFAMSIQSLPLFYIGFGVVGGIGLGLGYVTPVATAAKWFPDKKGFVTGMVVMGFGFGALFMSKVIAPALMNITGENLVQVFAYAGIILLVIGVAAGYSMVNPPADFVPKGYTPPQKSAASQGQEDSLTVKQSLLSSKFFGMWLVFFLNISAGIMFIGLQSPMLQDLLRIKDASLSTEALAVMGATLIAISSLFNGVGRFFWGALSDKIGRIQAFRLILGTQFLVFIALIYIGNPWLFGIMVCYVLLCYGGGFGTMPSYVLDVYHAKLMPVVYGVILTAWSLGGIVGPQVAAFIRDFFVDTPEMIGARTYLAGAILLALGFIVTLTLSNKSITEGK